MNQPEPAYKIRPAKSGDGKTIRALLSGFKLPLDGLEGTKLWVLESGDGEVLGVAGFELYGSQGLLRSVAVTVNLQNHGYGRSLVNYAVNQAKKSQVQDLFLLTTTAPKFFEKLGFTQVSGEETTGSITGSVEFKSACPKTAVLMHMTLR